MSRRRHSVAPRALADESEDVKCASATDRRVLRCHYRRLKASIAEGKEQLHHGAIDNFEEMVRRADDLYALVYSPREQIADAEALLDITEAFLNSVKDSRNGNAIKAADLLSTIMQNFGQPAMSNDPETVSLDWAAIGLEATCIFHDAPGLQTMLGPMDIEPKKRKAPRRRDRGPVCETTRPETVGDEGENQSQTDKNIRIMFNILRRYGDKGCELEQLVLSRDSFSHTVENIFCLSFLVKDGRAQINIQDGKQFVAFRYAPTADQRTGRSQGEADQVVNTQFVFRFDFKDWILMKEMVELGTELMPERSTQATPTQNPSTPIRKLSRNRGRTSSEPCEIAVDPSAYENGSEEHGVDERHVPARANSPAKKRVFI